MNTAIFAGLCLLAATAHGIPVSPGVQLFVNKNPSALLFSAKVLSAPQLAKDILANEEFAQAVLDHPEHAAGVLTDTQTYSHLVLTGDFKVPALTADAAENFQASQSKDHPNYVLATDPYPV